METRLLIDGEPVAGEPLGDNPDEVGCPASAFDHHGGSPGGAPEGSGA